MAQSSSDGFVICYVLPVLWMKSRLAIVGQVSQPATTSGIATPGRSLMSMNALFASLFTLQMSAKIMMYVSHMSKQLCRDV